MLQVSALSGNGSTFSAAETFIIKRKRYCVRKTFCALLSGLDLHHDNNKKKI